MATSFYIGVAISVLNIQNGVLIQKQALPRQFNGLFFL